MASDMAPETTEESVLTPERYSKGSMVKILVGPEEVGFSIYKDMLLERRAGGFFNACLKPGFLEARNAEVKLPGDDPAAFGIIVNWLFKGSEAFEGIKPEMLIAVYGLADKRLMFRCKNDAMDSTRLHYKTASPTAWTMQSLIALNLEPSPLYRFYIEEYAHDIVRKDVIHADFCDEGLRQEANKLLREGRLSTDILSQVFLLCHGEQDANPNKSYPSERKGCHYHHHAGDDLKSRHG